MSLTELLSLQDRIAIVTGASRGLGKAFAAAPAEAGAHLVIVSRHIDDLEDTAATERQNLPPEETTLENWSFVIETNVNGPFLCAREVGKMMGVTRCGSPSA